MITHSHPTSGVSILGTLLPFGTELLETDRYASMKGSWEPNPVPGAILQGNGAIWVRPSGDPSTLSVDSKALLSYLAQNRFLVTKDSWHWKIIPSLSWKHDGRMDWGITYAECIPELIGRGFLLPHALDSETFEVTESGRVATERFI